MSKRGRGRRTPEQRLAARDVRSTLAYLRRLQLVTVDEQGRVKLTKNAVSETTEDDAPVSETTPDASSK